MIISSEHQIKSDNVLEVNGLTKKIVIGPESDLVLRIMVLNAHCSTIYHSHSFSHIWKIEKGQGIFLDHNKKVNSVEEGDFIYVDAFQNHGLINPNKEPLKWLCFGTTESENVICK